MEKKKYLKIIIIWLFFISFCAFCYLYKPTVSVEDLFKKNSDLEILNDYTGTICLDAYISADVYTEKNKSKINLEIETVLALSDQAMHFNLALIDKENNIKDELYDSWFFEGKSYTKTLSDEEYKIGKNIAGEYFFSDNVFKYIYDMIQISKKIDYQNNGIENNNLDEDTLDSFIDYIKTKSINQEKIIKNKNNYQVEYIVNMDDIRLYFDSYLYYLDTFSEEQINESLYTGLAAASYFIKNTNGNMIFQFYFDKKSKMINNISVQLDENAMTDFSYLVYKLIDKEIYIDNLKFNINITYKPKKYIQM